MKGVHCHHDALQQLYVCSYHSVPLIPSARFVLSVLEVQGPLKPSETYSTCPDSFYFYINLLSYEEVPLYLLSLRGTEFSPLARGEIRGEGGDRKKYIQDSMLFQSWSGRFHAIGLFIPKI